MAWMSSRPRSFFSLVLGRRNNLSGGGSGREEENAVDACFLWGGGGGWMKNGRDAHHMPFLGVFGVKFQGKPDSEQRGALEIQGILRGKDRNGMGLTAELSCFGKPFALLALRMQRQRTRLPQEADSFADKVSARDSLRIRGSTVGVGADQLTITWLLNALLHPLKRCACGRQCVKASNLNALIALLRHSAVWRDQQRHSL